MQDILATLENNTARITRNDGQCIEVACDSEATFSSGELVAAALASCIASTLLPMLTRHALPLAALAVRVKAVSADVAEGLEVEITLPACAVDRLAAFQRAVRQCPVRRAIAAPVTFHWLTRE